MPEQDPVTAYAESVVAGREVASRLVRQACARHLDDLKRAGEKGLVWKPDRALRAINFFPDVLCLPERTDADEEVGEVEDKQYTPIPFMLEPWQKFIVGSLFGWYTTQGFRRFREALIEVGKGSGKTPLCAGMLIYMLVADGERGAQCFMAAATREQAHIAFTDAKRMVEASPYLSQLLDQKVNNLAWLQTGSFLRPISAEKRGLDGKRVHGAMTDELHEHQSAVVVNKMRAGTKGRRNALILKPTNSGFDRMSVLWQHHEYSRKVLDGTAPNETWFAYICGLDPCDSCAAAGHWFPNEECSKCDDWKTEGPHWRKANPNLGVSLPWQYLRERVSQAIGMPSQVNDVLRFNFCVWTQAITRFFDMGKWAACKQAFTESELLGVDCFAGVDLGQSDDLSAEARVWKLPDGRIAVKMRYWLPQSALQKYPNRPYAEWQRSKLLTVTDGSTSDLDKIEEQVIEDCRNSGVKELAYDKRFANQLALHWMGAGLDVADTPQGFALNEAIRQLAAWVIEGVICHGSDPILAWMASNSVVREGRYKELRLDKEKSSEKIDGISALVMAISRLIFHSKQAPSYQLLVLGGR